MVTIKHSRRVVINVKYLGPTNTKGARVVATVGGNRPLRVVIGFHSHGSEALREMGCSDAYDLAAREYCNRMKWNGTLLRGETDSGAVYVFSDD